MNISQRLRTCAKHTGLDAVIELLQEAADEIDALQARAQAQGEPVPFLLNGTRFKMSFQTDLDAGLDPITTLTCFNSFQNQLDGRWVALVDAEDDAHLKLRTPQPAQAMPVCGAQTAESDPQAVLSLTAATQPAEVTDAALIRELVDHIERNTCTHEETHRGGAIWEVCDSCGARWADDEGGKPEFKWPTVVEKARAILALRPEPVAAPMSEIDIEDDDSLRFVQRVLESDAPKEDRQSARDMVVGLRKRVRKAHHGITAQAKKEGA